MYANFPNGLAIPCFLLLGATFIMFVYHLLLYFQYRERIILKYCFYLLAISLYLLADINARIAGEGAQMTSKVLLADSFNFIVILAYASFIIEAIPGSRERYRKLYRIWQLVSGIAGIYILCCFAICIPGPIGYEGILGILNNVFRVVFVIIGIGASIILFPLMNDRFLNWIKWGAVIYLFFMGMVMLTMLATPANILFGLSPMQYVYLGILADIIIFSVAMSFKVKEIFRKVADVRNRLSRDLHDEIGATLSGVTLMSELVRNKLETKTGETIIPFIDRISEATKLMSEKMNDIVWAINPENDSLGKIIFRIQTYAAGICSARNIQLHVERPANSGDESLNLTARNNLYLICKEAINNAVKYSGARNIWVLLQQMGKQYRILIKDDGTGFVPAREVNGNGLKNIKARAAEMKASLDIRSVTGKGTTIELSFT